MRKRYVITAAAAATVVWVAVVASLVYGGGNTTIERADVAVPSLVGLAGESAVLEVEAAGLRFSADQHLRPYQSSYTGWSMTTTQLLSGRVVAQSPSAGVMVHPGGMVELSVEQQP